MRSESTSALGQPSETRPTRGARSAAAGFLGFADRRELGADLVAVAMSAL
jgi:hypothetical protein